MLVHKLLVFMVLVFWGMVARAQPVARYVYQGDTNLSPVRVCRNYQALFEDIHLGITSSVQWNFQGGNPPTSTSSNPVVSWNTNGTKNCSFTVYQGSYSNTINFQVIVSSNQTTPNFGFLQDVCSSDPAFLLTQGSPPGGNYFGLGVANNYFDPGVADTGYHTLGYVYTAPNGCSDTAYNTIFVKPGPTASLLELNGFSNCNGFSTAAPSFEIELYDQSTSPDSIISYKILWGDGTSPWDSAFFRPNGFNHTYFGQGIYQLNYVVTGLNGCTDTAKYFVVNTTNPASLNLTNPGGTNGCAPVTVTFPVSTTGTDNTVIYTVDWGDGNDTVFSHPPPSFLTHTYDTTSCIKSGGFFPITATATNACVSTQSTIQGPFVTQPGVVDFTVPPGCVGVPQVLNNMSIPGYTNACSRLSTYIWDFGDGSPPITQIVSTPVPPPGIHTWNAAGFYNVTLFLISPSSNCPGDTLTQTICIENPTFANVSIQDTMGCQPFSPIIVNTSDTNSSCTPVQTLWSVDQSTGWNIDTTTTSMTDLEPQITFTDAGVYQLSYYHFNNCGGDTITQTIYVKDVPDVALPQNVGPFCDTMTVNTANHPSFKPSINANGGTISAYGWSVSPSVAYLNGTNSTSQYPVFRLPPNTYTITHWATNECGTDTASQTLVVNPLTNGGFLLDKNFGCSPLVIQAQSTSAPGVQHWWYVDSVLYSANRDTTFYLTNTGAQDSNYFIQLVVYSGIGCTDTLDQTVTVYPNPHAKFSISDVCINSSTSFFDSTVAAIAPIVNWDWDFGDGTLMTGQNPQHVYQNPGKYLVGLTATDSNGCSSNYFDTAVVFSNPMAGMNIQYASLPDSACIQDSIFFIDNSTIDTNGTTIVAWQWDVFNDGIIDGTLQNTSYVFQNPGSYPVKLIVTSLSGCIDSIVDTVHISKPPTPFFTLDIYGGCTPVSVIASDSSSGYILNYLWRFYTLDSNQNQVLEHTASTLNPNPIPPFQANILSNKTVFVELTVSNSCYTSTFTDTINIKPIPIPFFAFSIDTGCSPLTTNIQVDGLATGNPDSIVFNWGDGTPGLTLLPNINILPNGDTLYTWNQQSHTFTYTGLGLDTTYYVTLYAQNECGDSSYTAPINVRNRSVQSFFNASSNIGCAPLAVSFNDFSFAALSTAYCFDFDTLSGVCNGNVYLGSAPSYTFTQPGTYVVAQFASNNCGSDTSFQIIDVRPSPLVNFSFPAVVCEGDTVFFTNNSSVSAGSIWSNRWYFGDGDSSLLTNPFHVYDTTGTFNVCLEIVSDVGCDSMVCLPIVIRGIPKADFTFTNNVCQNLQPIQFSNLSSNSAGNIISYQWYFGDGNVSTLINPQHTYSAPGTYDVKLVIINSNQCPDSVAKSITIYPVPDADFTYSFLSGDSCGVPQTIQFTNGSNGAGGYYWDFNSANSPGADTSNLMHPQFTFTQPGVYKVLLISRNGLGCQDTIVKEFRIHPIPEPDLLPSVTAGCAPLVVFFDNQTKLSPGFNDSLKYQWNFGDGAIGDQQYAYHTYVTPGNYNVKLIATSEYSCEDSILYGNLITVYPVPRVNFNSYPLEFGVYQFQQITTGGTPPYTYSWDFGDGQSSTEPDPKHEFVIDKIGYQQGFNVCLTVSDLNGCDSTICDTIEMGAFTLYVPNAMLPDGDGEETVFLPKGQGLETYHCQIFDRWGNKLWESSLLSPETASPVEAWDGTFKGEPVPAGVYIWRIDATFANGIIWRGQGFEDDRVTNSGTITILR